MRTAPAVPIEEFIPWLETGRRGLSSSAIVSHLSGIPITTARSTPQDPADFNRCERLLRAVPAARAQLHRMGELSPAWGRLAAVWDELVALGEQEVPGVFAAANAIGSAPLLYARIRELLAEPQPT